APFSLVLVGRTLSGVATHADIIGTNGILYGEFPAPVFLVGFESVHPLGVESALQPGSKVLSEAAIVDKVLFDFRQIEARCFEQDVSAAVHALKPTTYNLRVSPPGARRREGTRLKQGFAAQAQRVNDAGYVAMPSRQQQGHD